MLPSSPSDAAAFLPDGLLSRLQQGCVTSERAARWQPGHPLECRHGEVFAPAGEASGAGLALALALDALRSAPGDPAADASDERSWLWVQDRAAIRHSGRPYRPGLPKSLRHRLIHVAAETPEDALFALEEGLRCRDLAFVIGEIAGNPKALDFTASRRLSLAAERHGTALWLVRLDAARDLGSARMRWEVRAAPSLPPRWNTAAPGTPAWMASLFRAHVFQPGEWILRDDGRTLAAEACVARPDAASPHSRHLVRAAGDRSLAAG
jgi:protein ImuA